MNILVSLQSIFSIISMILIGIFFSYKKWFNHETASLFSKIVVNISVPGFMISNLVTNFSKSKLIEVSGGFIIPFTSMFIMYLFGYFLAIWIKVPENRRGIFASTVSISNTLFVGLPINLALYGTDSIPYVFIYFIVNVSFFWTIGAWGISRDGGLKGKLFSKKNLRKIFTAPLISFFIAIIIIFLEIPLPKFVMDTSKYMGNLLTPLSMLYIGITIYMIDFKKIVWDKSMTYILISRFLISPLLVYLLTSIFTLPNLMRNVFLIQSAMPAMTITTVLAAESGADFEYATIVTTLTTIFTLLIIPVFMFIFK
jgi:malate permease and related proteins